MPVMCCDEVSPAAGAGKARAMNEALGQYLPIIGFVISAYLLAGFVKGIIGMGLPTVALAVLAVVLTPAQAAALLIAPSLATNVWQMLAGPHLPALVRRLATMLLGLCVGAWLAADILTGPNVRMAALGVGIALVVYGAFGLTNVRFSVARQAEIWLAPIVGVATGAIMAATGIFVIPALPYLQALGLEKDDLVQALGLHFTFSTFVLALVLFRGDAFDMAVAWTSLLAVAPAVVGMMAGQWLRARVSVTVFRTCLFAGLLLIGLQLTLRNVF
jgi:uncharacterized protein